jgi:hypothetical protein
VYPPVRQFEQYEFTRSLEQLSRPETVREGALVSPWQRAWLAAGALLVVVAVVASYAVAAST